MSSCKVSFSVSSRDEILRRIGQPPDVGVEPPGPFTEGLLFTDPVSQFEKVLRAVGGCSERVASVEDAGRLLDAIAADVDARKTCSFVEGLGAKNFDLSSDTDPHLIEDVDLAIMPGQLAVAENAAIWVTAATPVERTMYFLTQHLVLVVPCQEVISNLHEAYERIDIQAAPFGVWISGPSKTADIEQSLVMGAHGPRSLTVLLIDRQ